MFDTGPSPGNDIQSNMYSVYSMLEREMAKKLPVPRYTTTKT